VAIWESTPIVMGSLFHLAEAASESPEYRDWALAGDGNPLMARNAKHSRGFS
jgi:hypothetical protein